MTTTKDLANRLLQLPIDEGEKVLLWLTYKGLKPVSNICAQKRDKKYLKLRLTNPEKARQIKQNSFDFDSIESIEIRQWIEDAGLKLVTSIPADSDWYVGKDEKKVRKVFELIGKFDQDSQYETGLLLGFPPKSVKAYVNNLSKSWEDVEKEMTGTHHTPYAFYNMPKLLVATEIEVSDRWAETIRTDLPKLARLFEKEFAKQINR